MQTICTSLQTDNHTNLPSLCLLSIKESFHNMFVIHCPGRKKDLEHTIWRPFGGIISFFRGGGIPLENKELLLGINAGTGGAPNFKIWSKSLFYLGFDTTVLLIHHSFLPSVLPHQSHFLCSYWTSLSLICHMHHRRSTRYRSGTWDHYSSRPTSPIAGIAHLYSIDQL